MAPTSARRVALACAAAAGLALVLGTLGYLTVGFGVLTTCTNRYGCTETGCAPCRDAGGWLAAGAAGQGLLLVVAVVVAVVARTRVTGRPALARVAWVVAGLAALWIVVSSVAARSTF